MTPAVRSFFARLMNLLRPARAERELTREVEAHLALLEDEYQRRGLTPAQASIEARRALGGIDLAKEIHRDERSFPWLEHLVRDLMFGARLLRKAPGFTVTATLTLALGIGAATSVFTQVNAIFLKKLPVEQPDQLRILSWTSARRSFAGGRLTQRIWDQWISEGHHIETFSYAAFRSIADHDSGFGSVACWRRGSTNSPALGPIAVHYVSDNYFETVKVGAAVGRALQAKDAVAGADPVAVISYSFWQRAFGGDAAVLGQTLNIESGRFIIVGVAPRGFFGVALASAPDVIAPLSFAPWRNPQEWTACNVVARVRAGVPDEQARARSEALVGQSILALPPREPYDAPRLWLANAERGDDDLRRATSGSLSLLMAITAIVFLIACANVAGLLLARGAARAREIATRMAVGASRGRVMQQLLTEYLFISALGVAGGVALAYVLTPVLPQLLFQFVGRDGLAVEVSPDARVLSFAAGLGLFNGALFSLLPALYSSRVRQVSLFNLGAPSARFTTGKAMVSVQVALSLVLLVAAGLCIRSLIILRAVPLGYEPQGLVFVTVNAAPEDTALVEQMLERIKGLPYVQSATASQYPLFAAAERSLPLCVPGFMTTDPDHRFVDGDQVTPRFFETWGIALIAGRDFRPDDVRQRHVIVNAAFAKKFYPQQNPIGLTLGFGPTCTGREQTVIGVVADSTNVPRDTGRPMIYVPYRRNVGFATLAMRVINAQAFIPALRTLLTAEQSSLRGSISTGTAYREREMSNERTVTALLVTFGMIALLLSCVGLHGALAYLVVRRTAEIGVRMALGAERRAVVRLIMFESITPVVIGLVAGGLGASVATRAVEHVLFGVSRYDPLVTSGAVLVFVVTAALASAVPAVRASRIDPALTLRHD